MWINQETYLANLGITNEQQIWIFSRSIWVTDEYADKGCHGNNSVIASSTCTSQHKLCCSQWRQSCHCDDWSVSVHDTVRCRYNTVNFLPNPHKTDTIACLLGRGMGCNLWFDTDLYSASVNAELYEISCYIRPRCNGTRLYTIYMVINEK